MLKSKSKILIAVDSFKGTLTSSEAAGIIEKGFTYVLPEISVVKIPLADGGDGTVEAIVEAVQGEYITAIVRDPLFRDINAKYGIIDNGKTAVIEMAAASGITLLADDEKNPLKTTTYGTGQLIKDAVERGCRKIILGIGGSATNEGGIGMAVALGAKFYDTDGNKAGIDTEALPKIASVDLSPVQDFLQDVEIVTLCDVSNPLCGETGASAVYGPQKGADEKMVELLDSRLARFAMLIESYKGSLIQNTPGAGAAGGLGFGAIAFLNSTLVGGTEYLLNLMNMEEHIKNSDIVITGEGKIDIQTKFDKLPMGIARLAKINGKISLCITGMFGEGYEQFQNNYFDEMYAIVNDDISLTDAMSNAHTYLNELSISIARELSEQDT
jgi:glycerate kinase